jgi:hypothetical protein
MADGKVYDKKHWVQDKKNIAVYVQVKEAASLKIT